MFKEVKVGKKPTTKFKHITLSDENYFALKGLGRAGDSFNDVVTNVLNKLTVLQSDQKVGAHYRTAIRSAATDQVRSVQL